MDRLPEFQAQIALLPEQILTRDIVIPLFCEMGYRDVRYVHGMFEHGVDVLCVEETPLGTEFCGIQVKATSITGSKVDRKGNVNELINQASSALRHSFIDEHDNTEKSLDKYFILTSAAITDASRAEIRDALRQFGRTVRFVDGQSLAKYVSKHLRSYVTEYFARRTAMMDVAHILRSPLQGLENDIMWLRSVLDHDKIDSRARQACDRAAAHVNEIGVSIKNYIHVLAPPRSLGHAFRATNVADVVRSVLRMYECRATLRGIALHLSDEPVGPIMVDPDALGLIISNLVDNAVKYSYDKRAVTVRLRCVQEEFEMEVSDFGLGIPSSELSRVWDRFYRCQAAINPKRFISGVGVGLSVVKELVEEMGGSVSATCTVQDNEHVEAGGTVRFTIRFPLDASRGTDEKKRADS